MCVLLQGRPDVPPVCIEYECCGSQRIRGAFAQEFLGGGQGIPASQSVHTRQKSGNRCGRQIPYSPCGERIFFAYKGARGLGC